RHRCSNGKTSGRSECSLHRTRSESLRDAKFVAGMCAYCVMRHELLGDLLGERGVEATPHVDCRQFSALAFVVCFEFGALSRKIGLLGVRLRMHRDVFTGSHRHRPGDETGDPCDQYAASSPMRGRDTQDQTGGRKDAVVRTQYRRPQPAGMLGAMPFSRSSKHSSWSRLENSSSLISSGFLRALTMLWLDRCFY